MEALIVDLIEQYGYIAIFLLITLENVFAPIPSEIILAFGGYLTYATDLTLFGAAAASTLGSLLGATILYIIGKKIGPGSVDLFISRFGKYMRVSRSDVTRARAWFDRHGVWTVFVCRLVPLVRSLISLPAGMARMDYKLFIFLTGLGSFLWNTLLISLGSRLGADWHLIAAWADRYSWILYGFMLIAAAVIIIRHIINKNKQEEEK
ncbi:MAG: DedA family protein [Clostridia bacterium]|nr:DedA family protein [Clostridia bacterium]